MFGFIVVSEDAQAKLNHEEFHGAFTEFVVAFRRGIETRRTDVIFQTGKFSVDSQKGRTFKIFIQSLQYAFKIWFNNKKKVNMLISWCTELYLLIN